MNPATDATDTAMGPATVNVTAAGGVGVAAVDAHATTSASASVSATNHNRWSTDVEYVLATVDQDLRYENISVCLNTF